MRNTRLFAKDTQKVIFRIILQYAH